MYTKIITVIIGLVLLGSGLYFVATPDSRPDAYNDLWPTSVLEEDTKEETKEETKEQDASLQNTEQARTESTPQAEDSPTPEELINPFLWSEKNNPSQPVRIGMPNPATVYCDMIGGKTSIVDTPQGQIGLCEIYGQKYPQWELFYSYSHCRELGGTIKENQCYREGYEPVDAIALWEEHKENQE